MSQAARIVTKLVPTVFGGADLSYIDKVLGIESANLIAYWPLGEASGTNADNAEGTAARDGTYNSDVSGWPVTTGVGDGNTAPSFDGSNDYVDVYSTSLNTAFDGTECTMMAWVKVSGAGVWTDSTLRWIFQLKTNLDNRIVLLKTTTNNQLQWFTKLGGNQKAMVDTSINGSTAWFNMILTVSVTGDAAKAYLNGTLLETKTDIGTWAGALGSADCSIGSQGAASNEVWDGLIAHCAYWSTPLEQADITSLQTV